MPTYMTIGMAGWMRHRGHSWSRIAEMAAAMYAPFLILLVPFAVNLVAGGGLLAAAHVLMLVAMLGVMLLRRSEYSMDHRGHTPSVSESMSVGMHHSRHS
jgi:flagellar biosynthetic protein FliP